MKLNVGRIDRAIRIVLGLALVLWAIFGGHPWAYLGIILLLTGLVGRCCLYIPFGLSTCRIKPHED